MIRRSTSPLAAVPFRLSDVLEPATWLAAITSQERSHPAQAYSTALKRSYVLGRPPSVAMRGWGALNLRATATLRPSLVNDRCLVAWAGAIIVAHIAHWSVSVSQVSCGK